MYQKKIFSLFNKEVSNIVSKQSHSIIPEDKDNIDYQEYLKWLSEGNEPEIINLQ